MMKKLLILIASVGVTLLAACNTVEGVGKDISKAGDAIEGAAKKAKN